MEECDCISCQESGHACHMDCDIDEPCLGCFEAAEEANGRYAKLKVVEIPDGI